MMPINDELLDDKIREKLRSEINCIPKDINNKIDDAVNKIEKRRFSVKKVSGICLIFIIGTLLLGMAMPTYASNIPIIGSIFKMFNYKTYENYDKYSSDLNITKESSGLKITINKVVYDGLEISIFYTIESQEKMEHKPNFDEAEIKINGKATTFSGGGGGKFIDDKKTYVGLAQYSIGDKNIKPKEVQEKSEYGGYIEIPDKFILRIDINKIEYTRDYYIKGKWGFDIPVSNEKVNGKVSEKECNIDLSNIVNGYQIKKIITTPINTAIQGTAKDDNADEINFSVFDDKGRYIHNNGGGSSGDVDEDGNFILYFNNEFKEIYDDTESLTFIPYKYTRSGNSKDEITRKLNLQGETKLYSADGEEYAVITKIETENGKTKMYYKSKYGINLEPIEVINNKNGEKVLSINDYYDGAEQNENTTYISNSDEYVLTCDKVITEGDYLIKVIDNSKLLEAYNDNKFTIQVK